MKIFYKIVVGVCVYLFLATSAYATTLVLKNGKTLEGKIVEQVNDYVKIDVGGTVLTYFNDEIEKIGTLPVVNVEPAPKVAPELPSAPVAITPTVVEEPKKEAVQEIATESTEATVPPAPIVEIKSSGFEIQAPQGWFTSSVGVGASGNKNTNIRYTKEPEGKIGSIPQISVVMDSLPEGENASNACDFAKYILAKWQKVVEEKKGLLNIIEAPSPVELNGIAGCGVVVERKTSSGKTLKIMDFKFIKDKTVISIQCMDWLENFDSSVPDFEAALSTFSSILKVYIFSR